ncbi:MAG TPA: radical SAM protein [Myxococcales bacterium]|nr:radical SAM protein [Myxococcales bacterium]
MKAPQSVCFRVTRACNARCGFCLAPWDGEHPDEATLARRIDWLLAQGVKALDFCGGEPTIHPALPRLIERAASAKTRVTTNGISMPPRLVEALQRCGTQVKVSLHGARERHDLMVGVAAFDCSASVAGSLQREEVGVFASLRHQLFVRSQL